MGNKLKEFILKELVSDSGLKEKWQILTEKRFGAMARIIGKSPELKDMILPPPREIEGNRLVLSFFETIIKTDLLIKIREKFGEEAGRLEDNEEFEISYLEAKEDLLGQRKARQAEPEREERKFEDADRKKTKKYDYELLTSGKKVKFLTSQEAEEIRERNGLGRKSEIFIDDERKEAFFNKKLLKNLKDQNYALLLYFVENEGVGGNFLQIYDNLWEAKVSEDKVKDAVEKAVSRFRMIIKRYGLGDVPGISKNRYSTTKAYIMKPKPKYCILRKIEKDNEE